MSMSVTSVSRAAVAAVLTFFAAAALMLAPGDRADASDPVAAIAAAPDLHWGFKATWRNYAQDPEVSGGATEVAPTGGALGYDLEWAFDSGTYDPEAKATHLEYSGTVRWKAHRASLDGVPAPPGYSGEPDPYILDVTFSDPQVTISREESALTVEVRSRDADTWQMIDYGRVPLVNLDVLGATPAVAAGTTTWSGLTATVTELGHEAMAGFYRVGQVVDPVSFSYEGPGGAPDLTEHWDTPGAPMLELVQNELFYDAEETASFQPLWVDRENLIVHSSRSVVVGGVSRVEVRAFSLARMEEVGSPIVLPTTQIVVGAFDASGSRLLYRQVGEGGMRQWLEFDLLAEEYETGALADPQTGENGFFGTGNAPFIVWDKARDRGYRIQRIVPPGVPTTEFDDHQWQLMVFEEGESGTWVKRIFQLPGFPAGQNREGYAASTASLPRLVVASDGSLIALASTRLNLAATEEIPGAYRIVFSPADDAIAVQPVPGLEVLNTIGAGGTFAFAQAGANGDVLLMQQSGQVLVQCAVGAGGTFTCEDPVSVKDNVEAGPYDHHRYAVDPADGTVWFGALTSQKVAAFRGGAFLGAQFFKERHPKGGPVLVGDDHFVYAQTNDGSPGESGGSKTWGYGKFERLGFVPTVTGQPQDEAAALSVGEPAEEVGFSSTATGDPAPARQWQVKVAGSLKFTDLDGETAETLTVDATRNEDGASYRAVYSNAAGRVATDPATLTVSYAPLVLQDPVNVVAVEGDEAEFAALFDGDPAPAVTWQRRVGGFWQDIDPGDENFEVDGQRLTVLETNTEQSGSRFRVKLSSPLGEVVSKDAKLTVNPKASIPPQGVDLDAVSLDWTGGAELQKAPPFGGSNYFSAGFSSGDEASYRSVAGNSAIYQVSAGGGETLATYAGRAAHIGGGTQLARLFGGEGRIEADGSVEVAWDGAFSVNFYGGLLPFTLADPVLEIDDEGDGTLSADLSGFASSMANPGQRTPLAPVPDITVATFSGLDVDPAGGLTIAPHYAGVEVVAPPGSPPQDKVTPGWGAWPQPFVDFHGKTGLASYWYSSGGAFDPHKAPSPIGVDFEGGAPPAAPAAAAPPPGADTSEAPQALPRPKVFVRRTARVRRGKATIVRLACPGPSACALRLPEWVTVKIAGRTYWAKVIAPEWIGPGRAVKVKLRLSRAARLALGKGTARARLRIAVDSGAGTERRLIRVRLNPQIARPSSSEATIAIGVP